MRVHQNQVNPNAQLDAMFAAQKAAAKRETERTRKKLLEFASVISGEAETEAAVSKLDPHQESEEGKDEEQPRYDHAISDWA